MITPHFYCKHGAHFIWWPFPMVQDYSHRLCYSTILKRISQEPGAFGVKGECHATTSAQEDGSSLIAIQYNVSQSLRLPVDQNIKLYDNVSYCWFCINQRQKQNFPTPKKFPPASTNATGTYPWETFVFLSLQPKVSNGFSKPEQCMVTMWPVLWVACTCALLLREEKLRCLLKKKMVRRKKTLGAQNYMKRKDNAENKMLSENLVDLRWTTSARCWHTCCTNGRSFAVLMPVEYEFSRCSRAAKLQKLTPAWACCQLRS